MLREQLRGAEPKVYFVPEGKILSPAAREYLQQRKIRVAKGEPAWAAGTAGEEAPAQQAAPAPAAPRYVDGRPARLHGKAGTHDPAAPATCWWKKANRASPSAGKLDSLQAQVVLAQALLHEGGGNSRVIADLGGLLSALREMMRCDVLGEEYRAQPLARHEPRGAAASARTTRCAFSTSSAWNCRTTRWASRTRCSISCARRRARRRLPPAAGVPQRAALHAAGPGRSAQQHVERAAHMMCMVLAGQYGK